MKARLIHWAVNVSIIPAVIIFTACPDVVEDPDPPAAPRLVEKSLPEAWAERGIDSDNTGGSRIVLMWHPNRESDLQGYAIYRADTVISTGFNKIGTIDIYNNFGADTVYYDENVHNYVDYYYFIRALDNADNLSKRSDTVKYRLLRNPVGLAPDDIVVSRDFTFEWLDGYSNFEVSHEYVLRLDYLESDSTVWIARLLNKWYENENKEPILIDYFTSNSNWPQNVLVCNEKYSSLPAGLYRWKVKAISEVDNSTNLDEASAESEWLFFEIQ